MALTGMFGGKVDNLSHFTADVAYYTDEEGWDEKRNRPKNREVRYAAPTRRREQRAKLDALGFKTRYFQFDRSNEKAKAKAKAACEAFAVEWEAKVGFKLEICEGFFL